MYGLPPYIESVHYIDGVQNFRRESDYDGCNDYYVNPEYQRPQSLCLRERNITETDNELIPDEI